MKKKQRETSAIRMDEVVVTVREEDVILDADLAALYGVETKTLIRMVKRNHKRFPLDFMFRLEQYEFDYLRSQHGKSRWNGRRYRPFAFTQLGLAMLSSVLKSDRAIEINSAILRDFINSRQTPDGKWDEWNAAAPQLDAA